MCVACQKQQTFRALGLEEEKGGEDFWQKFSQSGLRIYATMLPPTAAGAKKESRFTKLL
jgi:hypothetical protein